jgi:hypothetical protein
MSAQSSTAMNFGKRRRKGTRLCCGGARIAALHLGVGALLGACHAGQIAPQATPTSGTAAGERAYHPPPRIVSAYPGPSAIVVDGLATAGATIRVATPRGSVMVTRAGRDGRWRLIIERSTNVRLFGLAMIEGGRTVQSEGYLAIPPSGPAAQLRAGSGAMVFAPGAPVPQLLAVDYDGKGGAVVSGTAPPGAPVTLSVDGARRDKGSADPQGRFSIALDEPPFAGGHSLAVAAAGSQSQVSLPEDSIALRQPPFEASPSGGGWRIVWMTPGGGLQATLLLASGGRS